MIVDKVRKVFGPYVDRIVKWIGKVGWEQTHKFSEAQKQQILDLLANNYLIILTRHSNKLSTYAIAFTNLFLTGRWGYYAHVLMNLEDTVTVVEDFRLLEATSRGVTYSTFDEVFGTSSSVCFLKPANMSLTEWTSVLDKAKAEVGKPYDTLYDLVDDTAVSCVELVRDVLMASPGYAEDFADFEKMITKAKNLAPQMFRDCKDFDVVLEIKADRIPINSFI